MSIEASTLVWKHSKSRHGSRLVLLALADHADKTMTCFPAVGTLMKETLMCERAVQDGIKELVALGELSIRANEGPRGVNLYTLTIVPTPADIAPPPQNLRGAENNGTPRRKRRGPPQNLRPTPAESAPKPSGTINKPSLNHHPVAADDSNSGTPLIQTSNGRTDGNSFIQDQGIEPSIRTALLKLFDKPENYRMTDAERKALDAIGTIRAEDLKLIAEYHAAEKEKLKNGEKAWHSRTLQRLLEKFTSQLSLARKWKAATVAKRQITNGQQEPPFVREWLAEHTNIKYNGWGSFAQTLKLEYYDWEKERKKLQ